MPLPGPPATSTTGCAGRSGDADIKPAPEAATTDDKPPSNHDDQPYPGSPDWPSWVMVSTLPSLSLNQAALPTGVVAMPPTVRSPGWS